MYIKYESWQINIGPEVVRLQKVMECLTAIGRAGKIELSSSKGTDH